MGADQAMDADAILERIAAAFARKNCLCVGCTAEAISGLCRKHWALIPPDIRRTVHLGINGCAPTPEAIREIAKIAAREGRRGDAKLLNETANRMLKDGKASDN